MSSADSIPVLVVGAGPAALVAALTLLRNGVPVRIIEKETTYRLGQRGAGIQPRSLELFKFLGVQEVDQQATPLPLMRTYRAGTMEPEKTFVMSPYQDPTPKLPYFNPLVLGQQTLEGILRSHIEKFSCSVETGTELRSLEQFPDHVVAHIIKKCDGEEIPDTINASWIIGADGARGVVRKQLGLTLLGETRDDMHVITGDILLSGKDLDAKYWHIFGEMNMNSNSVTLRPTAEVGSRGWQFVISGPNIDFAKLLASKDEIFKFIDAIIPAELTFTDVIWASEFRANVRMVNKFGEGRVFLAGDAAHVHSPTGGQGLNSSVQDSFNLAWKLALVHKGLSSASLLDTYSTERLPVIAEMLNLTTALLNKTVGLAGSSVQEAFQRGEKLYMLGVNYRSSPIVLDEIVPPTEAKPTDAYGLIMGTSLQAGDRAPDAPGLVNVKTGEETRFFDIFHPTNHTVFIFASEVATAAHILPALERFDASVVRSVIVLPAGSSLPDTTSNNVVLEDKKGHAYDHYLVGEETRVVVVRPDGVIGAIVRGAEGVTRYFDGIFISQA